MSVLNPIGLWALALLPLLVIPYLLERRPKQRTVAALFLYQGVPRAERLRVGRRLRLEPLFWLQLLVLLLAALAATRPALESASTHSALVIDDAATLGARGRGGALRFEDARQAMRTAVERDPSALWDLFLLAPTPHEIGRGLSRGEVLGRLAALQPSHCRHADGAALASLFATLSEKGYAQVHLVSDRRGAAGAPLELTTVGAPLENLAITDATLTPSGPTAADLEIAVESFAEHPAAVPVVVTDTASGEERARGTIELAAGATSAFRARVPAGEKLRVAMETGDALAADDSLTVSAPRLGGMKLLVVGARAPGLEALADRLGLTIERLEPEEYDPSRLAGHDLVIFHLAAPSEPPVTPALYLLPPPSASLPAERGRVDQAAFAFADPTHPLVRYLTPGALRPRRIVTYDSSSDWQPVAIAGRGAALLARPGGAGTAPAVLSGIDLLPYLGDRNRAVSILTLNALRWLAAENARTDASLGACGGPLGRDESDLRQAREMALPKLEPRASRAETITRPLWAALAFLALALLLVEATLAGRPGRMPLALRIVGLLLLAGAAIDPVRHLAGEALRPLLLLDVSRSVLPETRSRGVAAAKALGASAPEAISFAARPVPPGTGPAPESAGGDGSTDLEAALLSAAATARDGTTLLLASDGFETHGEARRVVEALKARSLRVDPIAANQELAGNVAVESLRLPAESAAGRSAAARLLVRNDNPAEVSARLRIREGDRILVNDAVRLSPGENVLARPVLIAGEGLLEFTASLESLEHGANRDSDDDRATAWVTVGSRRAALIVTRERERSRLLERALSERGFRARVVDVAARESLPDLGGFPVVVLDDVPLSDLPRSFPEDVAEHVRRGNGLLMTGGPKSFGLGGYRGSLIEDILPVRMKPPSRDEPRSAVALVIDKSGSMEKEDRMLFAREAARQLVEHLNDRDELTVIGFDRRAFVVVPLAPVGEIRDDFEWRIERLRPVGGTRLFPALVEARRQLLGHEARRRHIIVLSDGLSEDTEDAEGRRRYADLALALAEQGVTISTIALGAEADTTFLERLASFGRGVFHTTTDPSTLPEIVLGEFEQHGKERTMREEERRVVPRPDSPLVGDLARAEPRWPPVLGLVETELKPGARLDVGVAGEDAPPLVASWQRGSGRAAAVTTDAHGRWSDRWARWKEWSRFWGDVAGWLAPERASGRWSAELGYAEGGLVLDYSRFDEDPAGALTARVTGPGGLRSSLPLTRTAPGHYRGRLETRTPGDYRFEILGPRGPVTSEPLGYTLAPTAVAERPRRQANWPLLAELAAATGGTINPAPGSLPASLAPGGEQALAPGLLVAAMIAFLFEIVLRRIA